MKTKYFFMVLIFAAANLTIHAQHKSHYTSEIKNDIKALTESEVHELLNGAGMGLAKAAELNKYPGQKHVMDLSTELNLTPVQKEETEIIFNSMKDDAVNLGKLIIQKEKELDSLFSKNNIVEQSVYAKVIDLGELKAKLRFVHLKAHIEQKNILSAEQIKSYVHLRGYN